MREIKKESSTSIDNCHVDIRAHEFRTIREVLAGRTEEYRLLVSSHKGKIFSMILRMVGERGLAEELTQEVFVRAYSSLATFRFEASFSSWLTRIALNHTNSYFQSRKFKESRITVSYEPILHEVKQEDQEEPPDSVLLEAFREALQDLKPLLRDTLVLCALEGKSYEEVSGILDIPIGTVRSRLSRAREQLKELIESKYGVV